MKDKEIAVISLNFAYFFTYIDNLSAIHITLSVQPFTICVESIYRVFKRHIFGRIPGDITSQE